MLAHRLMLLLLLALGSQVPAPCPQAAAAARETDAGSRAYRREAVGEAATHFAVADSLCPGDHATLVGLGFVFLRHGQARAGAERFLRAVASDATSADAWYALGLARSRLGQRAVAVDAWRRTLRLAPAYADAEQQLLGLGIDSGLALPAVVRPVDPDVAARTAGDGFEIRVRAGGGRWPCRATTMAVPSQAIFLPNSPPPIRRTIAGSGSP